MTIAAILGPAGDQTPVLRLVSTSNLGTGNVTCNFGEPTDDRVITVVAISTLDATQNPPGSPTSTGPSSTTLANVNILVNGVTAIRKFHSTYNWENITLPSLSRWVNITVASIDLPTGTSGPVRLDVTGSSNPGISDNIAAVYSSRGLNVRANISTISGSFTNITDVSTLSLNNSTGGWYINALYGPSILGGDPTLTSTGFTIDRDGGYQAIASASKISSATVTWTTPSGRERYNFNVLISFIPTSR
jgi:hypothetical protein